MSRCLAFSRKWVGNHFYMSHVTCHTSLVTSRMQSVCTRVSHVHAHGHIMCMHVGTFMHARRYLLCMHVGASCACMWAFLVHIYLRTMRPLAPWLRPGLLREAIKKKSVFLLDIVQKGGVGVQPESKSFEVVLFSPRLAFFWTINGWRGGLYHFPKVFRQFFFLN